jgi:hypothetical protein
VCCAVCTAYKVASRFSLGPVLQAQESFLNPKLSMLNGRGAPGNFWEFFKLPHSQGPPAQK